MAPYCPFAENGEFGTSRGGQLRDKLHRLPRGRKSVLLAAYTSAGERNSAQSPQYAVGGRGFCAGRKNLQRAAAVRRCSIELRAGPGEAAILRLPQHVH